MTFVTNNLLSLSADSLSQILILYIRERDISEAEGIAMTRDILWVYQFTQKICRLIM
jgi:hypothetical protein